MTREARLPAPWALGLMGWLTAVLMLDADGGRVLQRLLGLLTWLVLAVALSRVSFLVRVQTGVVVALATAVEYTFSPTLEVYLYRFHNVPAYVPPGHGLVYLSAYALGHALWVRRHQSLCMALVLVGLGGWATWSLLQPRHDVLGAFWFVCLAGFLWRGPSRDVYLGAAAVVTWLEIVGTSLGNWTWQPSDPAGLIGIGNPPTGAAGGYGWFDLAALLLAPTLIRGWGAVSGRRVTPAAGLPRDRPRELPRGRPREQKIPLPVPATSPAPGESES